MRLNRKIKKSADKLVPQFKDEFGRPTVSLMDKKGNFSDHTVAKIVAETFIPNPNNYKFIKHIDGNIENCVYTNLMWVEKE